MYSQVRAASLPLPTRSPLFVRRTMSYPVVLSTKRELPESLKRLFVPIISIDHLSQDYQDLPVDNILSLGDQALLRNILPGTMGNLLLQDHSITEPEVIGPLVTNLYDTLTRLKSHGQCEVLLYLSGHGMDPGNICLVPDAMKPHPTRSEHDLRHLEPHEWYKYRDSLEKDAERYLEEFYCNYANAFREYSGPMGFVGGEVCVHHRGFIGVLGVLGLWCHAHRECEGDTYHHLVIVTDCCFAGIWGATLDHIMKSGAQCLEEYCELLLKYPVSIQCATNEFEASHGGLFTPLWCFLQKAEELLLESYIEKYKHDHGEPVSRDFETQHPWFISTSAHAPSCKCFGSTEFFVYLLGEQLKEVQRAQQNNVSRRALDDACIPGTTSVARPRLTALASAALQLQILLKDKEKRERNLNCPYLTPKLLKDLQTLRKSIHTIKQSLAYFSTFLHEPEPRFRQGGYVLDEKYELTKASRRQLTKTLQRRNQERTIPPGVYVFQGGEGDMSLIVTPGCKQVILIDGTKTADCFKAAWDSTLRYLPRITHIFVTHHDMDHTKGIQLLLARYCVGQADIPDISRTTIYMNTRAALRRRSFGHEEEICTLATTYPLNLQVRSVIVGDHPLGVLPCNDFFIEAILPKQSLVDEVMRNVVGALDGDNTKAVSSRGGTTAANVLSINVVAVWKKREAYLFTGDAHLADVTQAADDFLKNHGMKRFKYVDVPHHGSANSNVKKVNPEDYGLARIPADHYLISHRGNHHNPSLTTVTHILKSDQCLNLHFLYPSRRQPVSCRSCLECSNDIETHNWHCECVIDFQDKIDTELHVDEPFKFFAFD